MQRIQIDDIKHVFYTLQKRGGKYAQLHAYDNHSVSCVVGEIHKNVDLTLNSSFMWVTSIRRLQFVRHALFVTEPLVSGV